MKPVTLQTTRKGNNYCSFITCGKLLSLVFSYTTMLHIETVVCIIYSSVPEPWQKYYNLRTIIRSLFKMIFKHIEILADLLGNTEDFILTECMSATHGCSRKLQNCQVTKWLIRVALGKTLGILILKIYQIYYQLCKNSTWRITSAMLQTHYSM